MAFAHRCAAVQVLRDEVEGPAVVQKLANVVGVGLRYRLARQQPLGLLQRELGPLDVRRVVGLQHQRPLPHLPDPVLGQRRRLQEPPGALDAGERGDYGVGDR